MQTMGKPRTVRTFAELEIGTMLGNGDIVIEVARHPRTGQVFADLLSGRVLEGHPDYGITVIDD